MKINGKQEVLASIARRSFVFFGLLATALIALIPVVHSRTRRPRLLKMQNAW